MPAEGFVNIKVKTADGATYTALAADRHHCNPADKPGCFQFTLVLGRPTAGNIDTPRVEHCSCRC